MTNESLKYHFHPAKGWLNDPNGLSYFGGKYHIFYQHLPSSEYPDGSSMNWGHAVTSDFLSFEELPVAIKPDTDYDTCGVWSGTATEIDGKLYAFYASLDKDKKQTISIAYSEDGVNFAKYPGNPVIRDYPADGSADFRDPAVLCLNGEYYLVIASADKKKGTGNLLLYKSQDIFNWEYLGVIREYADCIYCECPSFVRYGDGFILSASVCSKNASNYFEVMYGSFDGKAFSGEIVSHFQKGPDEYAGQIFSAPDGRCILISWIPGWNYQPKKKCIGCLSLPLELKVSNGVISAYPVREVYHLLGADDTLRDEYIEERFVNKGEQVFITLLEKPAGN